MFRNEIDKQLCYVIYNFDYIAHVALLSEGLNIEPFF